MTIQTDQSAVFNTFHSPAQTQNVQVVDGVKAVTSKIMRAPFAFDSLVLSVNYRTQTDGLLLLEAQVGRQGKWSHFYKLGLFSKDFQSSFPPQQDEFAQVQTDMLALSVPADCYRYRISLYGDMEVLLLAACATRAGQTAPCTDLPQGEFRAQVEPISQMCINHKDKKRICSPTALTMALNYFGARLTLETVMREVFDPAPGIYGNWIFNTACAGLHGVESYVRRFESLAELPQFVNENCLTLASISYKKGELPGAAIESTAGHLVLVTGYENGRIWTADPAAATPQEVVRPYPAEEFARAWLVRKRGVAYIVRKK